MLSGQQSGGISVYPSYQLISETDKRLSLRTSMYFGTLFFFFFNSKSSRDIRWTNIHKSGKTRHRTPWGQRLALNSIFSLSSTYEGPYVSGWDDRNQTWALS